MNVDKTREMVIEVIRKKRCVSERVIECVILDIYIYIYIYRERERERERERVSE